MSLPPNRWPGFLFQRAISCGEVVSESCQRFARQGQLRARGIWCLCPSELVSYMMSCWQDSHHLKCKIPNSPHFSFFFGGVNALFACLSKSILAQVQTLAWWQAVVWIRDAKICADSSFYTIWVRLSQLAISSLKRHTCTANSTTFPLLNIRTCLIEKCNDLHCSFL